MNNDSLMNTVFYIFYKSIHDYAIRRNRHSLRWTATASTIRCSTNCIYHHCPQHCGPEFMFLNRWMAGMLIKADCYCIHNGCSASCIISTSADYLPDSAQAVSIPVDVWWEDRTPTIKQRGVGRKHQHDHALLPLLLLLSTYPSCV